MTTIDLSPLYRNSIGFDRLANLLEGAFRTEQTSSSYPPYDIEALDDNHYTITLAVAGFTQNDVDIQVERGVLSVKGQKAKTEKPGNYLYQGIANRSFQRKFNLAEHVKVVGAKLNDGLLKIELLREIPEAMKPRRIEINTDSTVLAHQASGEKAA